MDEKFMSDMKAIMDLHGPEVVDRMTELMKERSLTFPDRTRKVNWKFKVLRNGTVILDVQP